MRPASLNKSGLPLLLATLVFFWPKVAKTVGWCWGLVLQIPSEARCFFGTRLTPSKTTSRREWSIREVQKCEQKTHPKETKKTFHLHPSRLTWNLRIHPWKGKSSSKSSFSGSMLIFGGVDCQKNPTVGPLFWGGVDLPAILWLKSSNVCLFWVPG